MNKQPMVTFAPGQRVGSYELLVEIASGGTATVGIAVYRGAEGFERLVVVKRVHRQLTKDREFTGMLLDEARLASSIRHPNVVPVIDVVRADDEVILVMDYVESVSLSQLAKQAGRTGKTLPPAVVSRILVDTLVGLHEAHEAVDIRRQPLGIVHRDVSPQNVIVGVDGVSRVIDFGIAKARTRVGSTRAGVIKGKCAYMSPEQVDGKTLDRRSDVFAAGIVLWEALTGRRLFRGEDDFEELRSVMTAPIPPPSSLVPGLGPDVDAVIAHALARPLDERFQTAQAFARALEHAIAPASPRIVGEHVEALCGQELEMRHARLQAILGEELDRLSPRSPPLPTARDVPQASKGETLRMTPPSTSKPGTLPMAGVPSVETLRSEEGAPVSVETPLESDVPPPPRRSITPILLLVMLASLVVGAGVAAVWLTRGGQAASPTSLESDAVDREHQRPSDRVLAAAADGHLDGDGRLGGHDGRDRPDRDHPLDGGSATEARAAPRAVRAQEQSLRPLTYDAGMPRVAVHLIALATGVGLACTAFDFPAPDDQATDASADVPIEAPDAGAYKTLLTVSDGALFCAQLFRCPRLDEAVELSIALPVATPASPLGYSACMDWVAGPIDPERIGLTTQQGLLQAVATAGSCEAAYAALPVRPSDAGVCTGACPDSTDIESCARDDAGAFTLPCEAPYFGQPGTCYADDAGVAVCVSAGMCTTGLSCTDPSTLVSCLSAKLDAFTAYDCTLSGRQCASQGTHLADCLVPGHNTAPCPLEDVRDECDGTSVLHCAGGLLAQTELDCAAVGRTCSSANSSARCVGASDTCTPFDATMNVCSGTRISLCIGGVPQSFDCQSQQMQCMPGNATQSAHCG